MNIDLQFLADYQAVLVRLTKLLDVAFVPGSRSRGGVLDRRLEKIMRDSLSGRRANRDFDLTLVIFLVEQLERIAKYDPDLLKTFRAGLTSSRADDYFGARLEVNTASALIKQKATFKKTESPDFTIEHRGGSFWNARAFTWQPRKSRKQHTRLNRP